MDNNGVVQANRSTLRRVLGKFFQLLSRRLPMPSSWRVRLQIWHGVNFTDPSTTFLGEDVYFDDLCPENITVGKDVRITSGVRILGHFLDAQFIPEPGRPFRMYRGKVAIGNCVFIGMNAVIAKPISVGDWSIIGANTVVTKDVPQGAILVGSPARIIGYRNLKKDADGCTD